MRLIAAIGVAIVAVLVVPNVFDVPRSTMVQKPPANYYDVVVIGGGLAGVTAARAAAGVDDRLRVAILDKQPQLGGNSAKASSGINAVNSAGGDSVADFVGDTLASGKGLSDQRLVQRLAVGGCTVRTPSSTPPYPYTPPTQEDSVAALAFLTTNTSVVLDGIVQLGGHSHARTRTPTKGPNVGFALMRAQIEAVQAHGVCGVYHVWSLSLPYVIELFYHCRILLNFFITAVYY